MESHHPRRPVILCVLDGWGWSDSAEQNAIAQANTPVFDRMLAHYPHSLLKTCGTDVGLPAGQMGNSEVGHLNLGAGRIVDQDIQRIDRAIEQGFLNQIPSLVTFTEKLKATGGTAHVMGLISPGGVHSHQNQITALVELIDKLGIPVAVHAFLDGRDTPPRSADGFIAEFENSISKTKLAKITTVSGRYYAMDRDNRWERIEQAYAALAYAHGKSATNAAAAILQSYAADVGDEFVLPTIIGDYQGIQNGDGVFMANFRADRAREILTALLYKEFDGFKRSQEFKIAAAAGLVEYSEHINPMMMTLFPSMSLKAIMGEVISKANLRQFRIAETEKYAHVTYFFNGGVEAPFPGEERALIPSPKVATYDLQPEMSAVKVTDKLVDAVRSDIYDFIFVNYANPDMVGHTGILSAAIKAIETVDTCLGRLEKAVYDAGGSLFITADHGNAETMTDLENCRPFTSHTMNEVPAILVNAPDKILSIRDGRLADVAPTLLELMCLATPSQMTGRSLIFTAPREADSQVHDSLSEIV